MKKIVNLFAAVLTMAAAAAVPVQATGNDGITPADVKRGAEEKRQTIEKNTRQAARKAKSAAKQAKDACNDAAEKIQAQKNKAKADWEKRHPAAEPTTVVQ